MRIRLADAMVWQSMYERPWLYASSGRGADIAAWKQAIRSELGGSTLPYFWTLSRPSRRYSTPSWSGLR